ncbi:MAG TPA: 2-octaprenyl-6-methoxyphenyl hydroxylase [Spongiibacteraceae bacterium]
MNTSSRLSSERDNHYDVIIAGGGMVGISFALALNHLSCGGLKILIAESFAIPSSAPTQPLYRPSFDARATALSYGSRCILDNLGVWHTLEQHLAAITTIHVSERNRFGSVNLTAAERGWPALGYVVENAWLGNVLANELRRHRVIELLSSATVIDCQPGIHCAQVTIEHSGEQRQFTTNLLAIADGANSTLRGKLNIGIRERDYQRQAVVATICCSKLNDGCAYERFTDWGPMALLPLTTSGPLNDSSASNQLRMALVWTMSAERAQRLLAAADGVFLNTLQQRFGNRQGQFTRIGERHCYDLKFVAAEEQIRRQIVLIGNAAHSLHPVAGQGFNLALRDMQRLAEVICTAARNGETIGELNVLQRYRQRQAVDQWKTVLFSDRITALFERPGSISGGIRHLGLLALDLNIELKNRFIDQTAGFHPGAALGNYS